MRSASAKGRVALAALGLILVVAAVVGYSKYRSHEHKRIATEYVKRSRPEYTRIKEAMRRVYVSVSSQYLGGLDPRRLRRARTLSGYIRALRFEGDVSLSLLGYPRGQIKAVRGVLGTRDDNAMRRVDSPFLAGGSKEADTSHAVAGELRAYVRHVRAFVPEYQRLIRYVGHQERLSLRYQLTLLKGIDGLDRTPASPSGFKAAITTLAGRLTPIARRQRRLRPPPVLRRAHDADAAYNAGVVHDLRDLVRAVDALDAARARSIGARIDRRARVLRRRVSGLFRLLATKSRLSRAAKDLQRREARIDRGYRKLEHRPPPHAPEPARPKRAASSATTPRRTGRKSASEPTRWGNTLARTRDHAAAISAIASSLS